MGGRGMDDHKDRRKRELESLISIQEEMVNENKQIPYLTLWLIALTVLTLGISVVTVTMGG
jgi:hypothetical protein